MKPPPLPLAAPPSLLLSPRPACSLAVINESILCGCARLGMGGRGGGTYYLLPAGNVVALIIF